VSLREIPALLVEFKDLTVEYLVQETVVPLKQLGHVAGYSIGAAAAWALAVVLLTVASMRAIIDALPDGVYWEALGYLLAVLLVVALMAIFYRFGPRPESDEGAP
jgi:hypothetical protein